MPTERHDESVNEICIKSIRRNTLLFIDEDLKDIELRHTILVQEKRHSIGLVTENENGQTDGQTINHNNATYSMH